MSTRREVDDDQDVFVHHTVGGANGDADDRADVGGAARILKLEKPQQQERSQGGWRTDFSNS